MRSRSALHAVARTRSGTRPIPSSSSSSSLRGLGVAPTIVPGVLSPTTVSELLEPFGLVLTARQHEQVAIYLDLLLRWNPKINLTSVATAEECVTRHFGESLYPSRFVELEGPLVDIGSGAGFPGLALKIVLPRLPVTLLEPTAKKRAFLKEAARACGIDAVEVLGARVDDFTGQHRVPSFRSATARAVGSLHELVPGVARLLLPEGRLCLWLGEKQVQEITKIHVGFKWAAPIRLPLSLNRMILVGAL
jgi:16S rRNA (guanine527-N7)-methyltransferase